MFGRRRGYLLGCVTHIVFNVMSTFMPVSHAIPQAGGTLLTIRPLRRTYPVSTCAAVSPDCPALSCCLHRQG